MKIFFFDKKKDYVVSVGTHTYANARTHTYTRTGARTLAC